MVSPLNLVEEYFLQLGNMSISQPLVPVIVTLFGSGACVDLVRRVWRRGCPEFGWALTLTTSVVVRRGEDRDPQRRRRKMRRRLGGAAASQGMPGAARSQEDTQRILPRAL